jgi:hypothetical protein
MNRSQFEHAIRAAGAILNADRVLAIGSQAIHGSSDHLFPEAERSIEVGLASLDDPDGAKADLLDGSIGELSMFQESFGYYVQGVTLQTAVLPDGWRKRLVPFSSPGTNGVTALCLEPHDLWVSKAVAGRPKDREFCRALLAAGLVEPATLKRRLSHVRGLDVNVRAKAAGWLEVCT